MRELSPRRFGKLATALRSEGAGDVRGGVGREGRRWRTERC